MVMFGYIVKKKFTFISVITMSISKNTKIVSHEVRTGNLNVDNHTYVIIFMIAVSKIRLKTAKKAVLLRMQTFS